MGMVLSPHRRGELAVAPVVNSMEDGSPDAPT